MKKIIELLSNEDTCRLDIINRYQKESIDLHDFTLIEENECILILQENDEYRFENPKNINNVSEEYESFELCYEDGSRVYVSFPFLYV